MVSPMKYFAAMPDHRHPSYITHPLPTIIGASAEYFHQAVRTHWQVENNLHWMLDVLF